MLKILLSSGLLIASSFAYCASSTDLTTKWICTSNASSSDKADDQKADEHMKSIQGSAADSFAFAAKHCRDCTKITCEAED